MRKLRNVCKPSREAWIAWCEETWQIACRPWGRPVLDQTSWQFHQPTMAGRTVGEISDCWWPKPSSTTSITFVVRLYGSLQHTEQTFPSLEPNSEIDSTLSMIPRKTKVEVPGGNERNKAVQLYNTRQTVRSITYSCDTWCVLTARFAAATRFLCR